MLPIKHKDNGRHGLDEVEPIKAGTDSYEQFHLRWHIAYHCIG